MSDVVIALEELKNSIGEVKDSFRKITHASVWGSPIILDRMGNRNSICVICRVRPMRNGWATFPKAENITVCGGCEAKTVDQVFTGKLTSGKCNYCNKSFRGGGLNWPYGGKAICLSCAGEMNSSEQIMAKINAKLSSEKKKVGDMSTKNKTIEEAAIPYINSGLAEPFAIAIARDVNLIGQILDLWEQDWWKQYPPEDILVCAVLDGELSEDDGRWLNEIRSDHERLALSCVTKDIDLDWARALLGAGYLDHPEAVPDVLDGGHPVAIARIREIKVDSTLLPPQLEFGLRKFAPRKFAPRKFAPRKFAPRKSIAKATHVEIEKILGQLDRQVLLKIISGQIIISGHKAKSLSDEMLVSLISHVWERINTRIFDKNETKAALMKLAGDINLQNRSKMTKDQVRESIITSRGSMRQRISSAMKKHGIIFE